jgi:hypothetical protein
MKEAPTERMSDRPVPYTRSLTVFGNTVREVVLEQAAAQKNAASGDPIVVSVEFTVRFKGAKGNPGVPRFQVNPYDLDLCWEVCANYPGSKTFLRCFSDCNAPKPPSTS